MKLVLERGICDNEILVREIEFPSGVSQDLGDVDAVVIKPSVLDSKLVNFVNTLRSKGKIVIGKGIMNKVTCFFLERTAIDILMDPHSSEVVKRYDYLHHFNSGLNHVLVDIAKKKGIAFFFSLNFIKSSNIVVIAKEIGRINQNIFLCRKRRVPFILDFIVGDKNDIYDSRELRAIYSFFNISTTEMSNSLSYLYKIRERVLLRSKGVFVAEGISILKE